MTNGVPRRPAKPIPRVFRSMWIPPGWIEYTYYFAFSYSVIAAYLGIEVTLIAAGLTVALGVFCLIDMGSCRKEICAPIVPLLACVFSFILIQIVIYDTSLMDDIVRAFFLWMCGLIIVQSLSLRPGFLLRCTIVIFALGLIAVPYLVYTTPALVERASAGVEIGGGLRNANGLAVWFGFCVVVFGISALNTNRGSGVLLYGLAAAGSLLIVGLTVSRGALLGCAIALATGFRSVLKRGFVPVLLLIIFVGLVLESGLVDQIISNFGARSTEESGRLLVWPLIAERFLASPIFGVGLSAMGTYVPEAGLSIVPHNSFLFFALTSGIVPFALYLVFWIQAVRKLSSDVGGSEYSPFRTPLLLYALVAFILADVSTETWALLALTVGASAGVSHRRERLFVTHRRIGFRSIAPAVQSPSKLERHSSRFRCHRHQVGC